MSRAGRGGAAEPREAGRSVRGEPRVQGGAAGAGCASRGGAAGWGQATRAGSEHGDGGMEQRGQCFSIFTYPNESRLCCSITSCYTSSKTTAAKYLPIRKLQLPNTFH